MNIIDLHCDTIGEKVAASEGRVRLAKNDCHIDIEKMKKGGALAQFFAIFIPTHNEARLSGVTLSPYDHFHSAYTYYLKEMEANKDSIAPALNWADVERNRQNGLMSSILTIEDGVPIDGKMERVDEFYQKGVRLITLTWNYENSLGFPNSLDPEIMKRGLKPFGIEAIGRMNELGMLIDVSHLSDGGFYDVAKHSKKPFVASHSCCRALCNHTRCMTDDMLRLLGEKGGVCGINFCAPFIEENATFTTNEGVLRHALHIRDKAGIDAVALGSDFDGIQNDMEFGDYAGYPTLIHYLEKHFTAGEIDKICWKNAARVMQEGMK